MMATVVEPAISIKQTERQTVDISAETTANESKRICWVGEKRSPYQADIQVELMHLQAEADALLIKLQAQKAQTVRPEVK